MNRLLASDDLLLGSFGGTRSSRLGVRALEALLMGVRICSSALHGQEVTLSILVGASVVRVSLAD